MKVGIVGTRGIPAKYGGFETLAEYLVEALSDQFEITVFCASGDYELKLEHYKGCELEYIPFKANGVQSIIYDIWSIHKSINKFDKLLVLGASGGIVFPFYRKSKRKFILNFGGLDWKRSKWGFLAQKFLKFSESLAVKNSSTLISDNPGIQSYIKDKYNRESNLIAYGGDQVSKVFPTSEDILKYPFLDYPYVFSVARIQPDNNIDMILEAFDNDAKYTMVFLGNWKNSKYGIRTKEKFSKCNKIILLDAIYNQRELDLLRSNCKIYLHGHSAGGTNPSLVEAMNLQLPIFAYSSGFNEYTTANKALYFKTSESIESVN